MHFFWMNVFLVKCVTLRSRTRIIPVVHFSLPMKSKYVHTQNLAHIVVPICQNIKCFTYWFLWTEKAWYRLGKRKTLYPTLSTLKNKSGEFRTSFLLSLSTSSSSSKVYIHDENEEEEEKRFSFSLHRAIRSSCPSLSGLYFHSANNLYISTTKILGGRRRRRRWSEIKTDEKIESNKASTAEMCLGKQKTY